MSPTLTDDKAKFAQALVEDQKQQQLILLRNGTWINETMASSPTLAFPPTVNRSLANIMGGYWQNAEPNSGISTSLAPSTATYSNTGGMTSPTSHFSDRIIPPNNWKPFMDTVQVFSSPFHMHSMLVNVLGFGAEVCAILTHLILFVYCLVQFLKRRRRLPPDMSMGLALHISLVGLLFSIFTSAMHAYLLMFFEEDRMPEYQSEATVVFPKDSTASTAQPGPSYNIKSTSTSDLSEWELLCIYQLYIRDTLASLYLYLLVITLITYTKAPFPPRTPHSSRWRAIYVLTHSLPWVLAVGASLPICILNLGNAGRPLSVIRSFSLLPSQRQPINPSSLKFRPSLASITSQDGPALWSDPSPARGICSLNVKLDIVSASLELCLFIFPIILCIGIACSVCCCYPQNRLLENANSTYYRVNGGSSLQTLMGNNHGGEDTSSPRDSSLAADYTENNGPIGYSRGLILFFIVVIVITQLPFSVLRVVVNHFLVFEGKHNVPALLAAYLIQVHLFLFAAAPMFLLLALIFLERTYRQIELSLSKAQSLGPVTPTSSTLTRRQKPGDVKQEESEVLYTNCMLTSV